MGSVKTVKKNFIWLKQIQMQGLHLSWTETSLIFSRASYIAESNNDVLTGIFQNDLKIVFVIIYNA